MIAEMMAARAKAEIALLKAVRPVAPSMYDKFPHAVFETVDMRNLRYLNCPSKRYEGTVRFYVVSSGDTANADVVAACERLKDVMLEYVETGEQYQVKRVNLVDEGDIAQEQTEAGQRVYVKSLDFSVRARKLS